MRQIFDICQEILKAKKNLINLSTQGDYVKFMTEVASAELRDTEAELKDALQKIYRTEGEDKFKEVVNECKAYLEQEEREENKEIEISYFRNVKETQPTTIFLSKFLFSTKHRDSITELRKLATKEEKDDKKKNMPCGTISGTFKTRSIAGIEKYNSCACMDFDEKDNPTLTVEGMKAILSNVKEVYFAGLSIGGKGVFAIIKTDNSDVQKHSQVIETIGETLKAFGLNYDKSGKDVSRLRFISYDSDPYFNLESETFKTALSLPQPKKELVKREFTGERNTTQQQVEKAIDSIENQLIDLTSDYATWINLGFSLASEFGYNGEDYFLRISQYHPKFDPQKCMKTYQNLVKSVKSVKIGTFFKILKDANVKIN